MTTAEKVKALTKVFNGIRPSIFFRVTPEPIGSNIAIEFEPLNVDEMEAVCAFIRIYFTPTEKKPYRNRMVKFSVSQGGLPALIINTSEKDKDFEEIFGGIK